MTTKTDRNEHAFLLGHYEMPISPTAVIEIVRRFRAKLDNLGAQALACSEHGCRLAFGAVPGSGGKFLPCCRLKPLPLPTIVVKKLEDY
jgi:hypothetical protein